MSNPSACKIPAAGEAKKPGRPRVVSGDTRRTRLIEVAEQVFCRGGYHAATMSSIAAAAGMSKRTLYQVFESKVALFDALLVDRLGAFTLQPSIDDRPVEENFAALMADLGTEMLSDRRIALVRMIISEAPTSPELGDALRRHHATVGMRTLVVWAAEQRQQGRLEFELSEDTANVLFGMVLAEHVFATLLSLAPVPSRQTLQARAHWALQVFRFGISSEAARRVAAPAGTVLRCG